MNSDPVLLQICQSLVAEHGAHTILLYGSHADGTATASSDYDLAAFAPVLAVVRDARRFEGTFLDVFVYPEADLEACREDQLRLRGSRVLLQRDTSADKFLAKLDELFIRGPQTLAADEIAARVVWAEKMWERCLRGDTDGNYCRIGLLYALLEDYFQIRGYWYQGPKKALKWLEAYDPVTYGLYSSALAPGAAPESIIALVRHVSRSDA